MTDVTTGTTGTPTSRRARPNGWNLAGIAPIAFLFLAFALPLIVVVVRSVGEPAFSPYVSIWNSALYRNSIVTTIIIGFAVAVLCTIFAYPYAFVLARCGRLLRFALFGALMLSFWTSLLVRSYSWQLLLNDTGAINTALIALGVIDKPLAMIRTQGAVLLGMTHILLPFSVLAIYAQMLRIPRELELAAMGMGARPARIFLNVTLPLTLPGAVAGAILVFVLALGFYITPAILGGARDLFVGQAIILQMEVLLRPAVGAALAVILVVVIGVVLAIASKTFGLGKVLGLASAGGDE